MSLYEIIRFGDGEGDNHGGVLYVRRPGSKFPGRPIDLNGMADEVVQFLKTQPPGSIVDLQVTPQQDTRRFSLKNLIK